MPSPGSAGLVPFGHPTTSDFPFSSSSFQFLPYRNFSHTVIHRDSHTIEDKDLLDYSNEIYFRIVHPYDTDAFHHFISKHDLTSFYSLLVMNLRNGFPLGEMPPITDTVIFKNHSSTTIHSDVIDKYLTDEINAGRMSGPFSCQQVGQTLRGSFLCSPLLVSVQIQQSGTPDKLRVCRHLSKGDKNTPSMNSHINKDDFPTRFDTALRVADVVGLFLLSGDKLLPSWASLLVGSSFLTGFTSGDPHPHGLHFW
jgi:hypothetical protein